MEVLFIPAIHAKKRNLVIKVSFLEAPTRFELVIEVLQTFALPLGYGTVFTFIICKKSYIMTPRGFEPLLPP